MLVVESRSEQESDCDIFLHRRNVADTTKRRIANGIVDGVIVKKLVRSRHRAPCHLAQIFTYLPYFLRVARKKFFHNVGQNGQLLLAKHLKRYAEVFLYSVFVSDWACEGLKSRDSGSFPASLLVPVIPGVDVLAAANPVADESRVAIVAELKVPYHPPSSRVHVRLQFHHLLRQSLR